MSLLAPAKEPASELARYRFLGHTGLRVSPFALGAASLGSAWAQSFGQMSREDSFKLLDRFWELGGNLVDTAGGYQEGESERIIGDWMQERGNRNEMVIATKYSTAYKQSDPNAKIKVNFSGNSVKSMRVAVEDSLKNLKTDYIDIFYVHWWDWTTSIESVMEGLATLVRQGKVLYLGASDMPAWVVGVANEYAKAHGLPMFSVYQGKFSILDRELEREIIPLCRHYNMGLMTWNSMLGGHLQSKAQLEERAKSGEGLRSLFGKEQTPREAKASEVVEAIANELSTSLTAVALAYVMRKYAYLVPIVGGRKVSHLEQNIEALSINLSPEHMEKLDKVGSFELGFPYDVIGQDPHFNGGNNNWLMQMVGSYVYVQKEQLPSAPATKKE